MAWQRDVAPLWTGMFGIEGQYDFVRATFTDGSNVPRIPPMRFGGGAYWRNANWFVRVGLLQARAKRRRAFETPTGGYDLLKAGESSHRKFWKYSPWGPVEVTTGIFGNNLLNDDVRNSVPFQKDEVLLPGRNFKFFLNVKYGADKPSGPPGYFKAARKGYDAPHLSTRRRFRRLGLGPASISAAMPATAGANRSPTARSATPRPGTRCSGIRSPPSATARSSAARPATIGSRISGWRASKAICSTRASAEA